MSDNGLVNLLNELTVIDKKRRLSSIHSHSGNEFKKRHDSILKVIVWHRTGIDLTALNMIVKSLNFYFLLVI